MTNAAAGRLVPWSAMDEYTVRRCGLFRWEVVCISASDRIARECGFGARFWFRITAQRVAAGMNKVMMDALWQSGSHPYQHGAVPVAAVGGLRAPAGTATAASA